MQNFNAATFLLSCAHLRQLPPATGPEVAVAGRSNSGKSSTLNRLCQRRQLARVSKTPGRTQLINYFALPSGAYLVDLPGYGFAKVPEAVRLQWERLMESYLTRRESLRGLLLIMDIRHPLTPLDLQMLDWCRARALPVHILLNKADKLGRGAQQATVLGVRRRLAEMSMNMTVQGFSASSGAGLEEAIAILEGWLTPEEKSPA
ncbi:MAG: ribosome biogenesis GTP-binding protein YihA/YsxC [Thiotrichales bacterium]